ncbi:amidohydrolase family protein, partial [bacterium]|nr:amidohydrolase family protein [bacterium]
MIERAARPTRVIDGHVHLGSVAESAALLAIREATGIDQMALVAIQEPATGSGLPQSLWLKGRHPDLFYVFAGLNHATKLTNGAVSAPRLVEQVDAYVRAGCDGIKMIEGKPTARRELNVPLTDPYYREYWDRVEELGLPVICHINDPEEFWIPSLIPWWAADRQWGYGPHDVSKEQLYAEVDAVLREHPRLKMVFAHFYFLSADLPRVARFLDAHPGVGIDLAPGIEMLYKISRDPEAGRRFFIRYADRIVFGTD